MRRLSAQLHPRAPPADHALRAAAVALYPCHFFYAFLYYTDVAALASALLVLLLVLQARPAGARPHAPNWCFSFEVSFDAHEQKSSHRMCYALFYQPQNRPVAAAAAGVLSTLIRQTNAVWLAACLWLYALMAVPQRRRPLAATLGAQAPTSAAAAGSGSASAPAAAVAALMQSLPPLPPPETLATLALRILPGVSVLFSFAAFVVWNGGVTVGDRDAHKPRAHWARDSHAAAHPTLTRHSASKGTPTSDKKSTSHLSRAQAQLCYCTAAVAAALFPVSVSPRTFMRLARSLTRRGLLAALAMGSAALLAVHYGTIAHPYILADNRHFSFYLWKARARVAVAIPLRVSASR